MSNELDEGGVELNVEVYGDDAAIIRKVVLGGLASGLSMLFEFGYNEQTDNATINLSTDVPFATVEEIIEAAEMLEMIAEQLKGEQFQTAWVAHNGNGTGEVK